MSWALAFSTDSLRLDRPLGLLQLAQQLRRDRQQVAAGQFGDLADVAEAGPHDLGADSRTS